MTWIERLIVGAILGGVGIVYPLYSQYLRVSIGAVELCLSPVVGLNADVDDALKLRLLNDQLTALRSAAEGYERRSLVCRRVVEGLGN